MGNSRRDFLGSAALGVGGLVAATSGVSAAGATDHGKAGAGGFGLQSTALPPGATVAYHDPADVGKMPEFTRSLDGSQPKVTSGGWARSRPSTSCRS